jgi:DNA-binding NtrC family response regulator
VAPEGLASANAAGAAPGAAVLVIDLAVHPWVEIRRTAAAAPELIVAPGRLQVSLPSEPRYLDVSRTAVVLRSRGDGVTVESPAERGQVWLGLEALRGSLPETAVPDWTAVGLGPVVLWCVPGSLSDALRLVSPTPLAPGSAFRHHSAAAGALVREVRRMAGRRTPVEPGGWTRGEPFILAGETGAGKNVLAREACTGADPLVIVQPEEVQGWADLVPFYGAEGFAHDGQRVRDVPGKLDVLARETGVLLFDEIHTLDVDFKNRLVELLTTFTFRPRGDVARPRRVTGLPLFATSRMAEVADPARFPPDLFFRMGGAPNVVEVPPLRQRRWELPALAAELLQRAARESGGGRPPALHEDACRKLLLHDWPGNFRELEAVLREAASLAGGSGEVRAELIKVAPRAAERPVGAVPPVAARAPADLPLRLHWADLFRLAAGLHDLPALREALVAQRQRQGQRAANLAAVTKEVARLVRCDVAPASGCGRCFTCDLRVGGVSAVVQAWGRGGDRSARDSALDLAHAVQLLVLGRRGADGPGVAGAREQLAGIAGAADPEGVVREVLERLKA